MINAKTLTTVLLSLTQFSAAQAATDLGASAVPSEMELTAPVLSDPNHPNHVWVSALSGRVINAMVAGSVTILRLNAQGQGVTLTANHIFNPNPDKPGSDQPAQVGRKNTFGDLRLFYGPSSAPNGLVWPNLGYSVYIPGFTKEQYDAEAESFSQRYAKFPPKVDFVIGVLSGRQIPERAFLKEYDDSAIVSPADPQGLLRRKTQIASPRAGDIAMAIGFPVANQRQQSYSVGKILLADEGARFILNNGDQEESRIPFDAEKEFVLLAKGTPGMSGGGTFDRHGNYLGILVRGGQTRSGEHYLRILRADWIAKEFERAKAEASPEIRKELERLVQL